MQTDEDVLSELNVRIGVAEEGDRTSLDGVLAPTLHDQSGDRTRLH